MTARKYRKKPVVVEAIRYTGNISSILEWCPTAKEDSEGSGFIFESKKKIEKCNLGDWIVKDEWGDFEVYSGGSFSRTFDEIPEGENYNQR